MIISTDDVHLWCVYSDKIDDKNLLSQYQNLLSFSEKLQYRKFYFEKHRHQYLITRAMVRSVLSLYDTAIKPQEWKFKYNAYGKPYIDNNAVKIPLSFNISHTDNLIIMAVALGHEIGVDVEHMLRPEAMIDTVYNSFAESELNQLLDLSPEKKLNRFFDLWTLKEAYIKACGMGLSIPLDHFSYSFSSQGKITLNFMLGRNDCSELWQFWQVQPKTNYKISIALKSDQTNKSYLLSMWEITPLSTITSVNYATAYGSLINP